MIRHLDTILSEDTRLRDSGLEANILKRVLQDTCMSISEMCVGATTLQSIPQTIHSQVQSHPLVLGGRNQELAVRDNEPFQESEIVDKNGVWKN